MKSEPEVSRETHPDGSNVLPRLRSLKLHISEFPSSDVRNAREILTRSVSEGDTSQRFESVPSLTLRVEKDRNAQHQKASARNPERSSYAYASGYDARRRRNFKTQERERRFWNASIFCGGFLAR